MRVSDLFVVAVPMVFAGAAMAEYVPGVALVNPTMTGTTQYDGWIGLTAANYSGFGGFPGTAAWPAPVGSNRTLNNTFSRNEPGDATLNKTANGIGGGPYLAGSSIYFGGFSGDFNNFGGTLAVTDSTPVADLSNVVFQVQIGEAWTYDFYNHVMPVLSYNGGTQQITATTTLTVERFYNGTVDMPTGPEDVFINTYLLQWDLSGVTTPITDFTISFSGVQHAQVYGMRLDQSDVYTPVPAPAVAGVLSLGSVTAMRRRR